jgi:hypothetical protein
VVFFAIPVGWTWKDRQSWQDLRIAAADGRAYNESRQSARERIVLQIADCKLQIAD